MHDNRLVKQKRAPENILHIADVMTVYRTEICNPELLEKHVRSYHILKTELCRMQNPVQLFSAHRQTAEKIRNLLL